MTELLRNQIIWQHSEVLHLSKTGGPRSVLSAAETSERLHSRPA
ncbi:MAG: hypothetical protein ACJATN_002204 [Neolewinella sp.]|jgi:hypothetical protein